MITPISVRPCGLCGNELEHTFVDLGSSPIANALVSKHHIASEDSFYPLHVYVCSFCLLVQVGHVIKKETLFKDYLYSPSYSKDWLRHVRRFSNEIVNRFDLPLDKPIYEIGSNDGCLLENFKNLGFRVIGIDPALEIAKSATQRGINTLPFFFNAKLAKELLKSNGEASLVVANNVIAHVPNLNDFVSGIKLLLSKKGVVTIEFHHVLNLILNRQFDTIYHEHFSYFSLWSIQRLFRQNGLEIFDVEEISSHGGSLRVFGQHVEIGAHKHSERTEKVLSKEAAAGLHHIDGYRNYSKKISAVRDMFISFISEKKNSGKSIICYGAPAKGVTFLNFCGVKSPLIEYTVDKNPKKQGRCLPGSGIPILPTSYVKKTKPDYVLILPWNIKNEIRQQMSFIRKWGGKFLVAIPVLEELD